MMGLKLLQNTLNKQKCKNQTVAATIVNQLEKLGVNSIFGYPGASVLSLYNELSKSTSIKHYLVRHEQAAVHAAEGYARISGQTGVVLVTSGPGFTNTITGLANAYADSTPLLVLVGDVPKDNKTSKIFQNVNIEDMVKSCTKKIYSLSKSDNIPELINFAYNEANSGVKGPVVISMQRNVLEETIKTNYVYIKYQNNAKKLDLTSEIDNLSRMLKQAKMPLILVGGGAINASNEVIEFVNNIKAPVVSTLMGIGIYPSSYDNYLGMVGINGTYVANSAINKCDLLIALGVSFSDRTTCKNNSFAAKSKIVSINIKNNNCGCKINIESDVKDFLSDWLKHTLKFDEYESWESELNFIKDENISHIFNSSTMDSQSVLNIISEYTKKYEPVVVTDVGQHQMLTAQFFTFNKPRKFITSGGMGTMGFGLPAAYGAQLANPNQLILNITGDGSFQMNLQELATCREHNIPIKIIILNNSSLGMVKQLQEKSYKNTYQVDMINPDFTKIAEAYDLLAVRVMRESELIPALDKIISHKGTAIMDIILDSSEII